MKSIGIVGCGAIGRALLTAVENGKLSVLIAGVTSRTEKSARELLSTFRRPPPYLSLPELIAASDLIVEAAGGAVVPRLAEEVFAAGKDLMVISAGALLDHPEIMQRSRRDRLPSLRPVRRDCGIGRHQVRLCRCDRPGDDDHT